MGLENGDRYLSLDVQPVGDHFLAKQHETALVERQVSCPQVSICFTITAAIFHSLSKGGC